MLNWISPEETLRVPEDTGIDIFVNYSLEVTLPNSRVPVRIYDSDSVPCLKQ